MKMNEQLAMTIGAAARTARLRAHLTQAETAEQIGIANEVYARLERGHSLPRAATILKLCAALHISADVLLGMKASRPLAAPGPRAELHRLQRQLSAMSDRSLQLLRMLLLELKVKRVKPRLGARSRNGKDGLFEA
jgi:transcriptional regulator with XRE-family HTH domain